MATSGVGDDYPAKSSNADSGPPGLRGRAAVSYINASKLPQGGWPKPQAVPLGISPKPLEDLLYHSGKLVPRMVLQSIGAAWWEPSDIESINMAITLAMQDRKVNNVIRQ